MGSRTLDSASSGAMRAYLFDSWVVFLSPRLTRAPHRHGVMQMSISLTEAPHHVSSEEGPGVEAWIHLIAPNTVHGLECSSPTAVTWIEPESDLGRRLSQAHLGDTSHATLGADVQRAVVSEELVRALEERWSADAFRTVGNDLYERLTAQLERPNRVVHPAVRKALALIRADPSRKIRAADLAGQVGLSESRFLHLFTEHVGLPLRAYLRWRRVFGALAMIVAGNTTATEAAAAMGFTDSAHLSRVMRDFLAISPSGYARRPRTDFELVDCMHA